MKCDFYSVYKVFFFFDPVTYFELGRDFIGTKLLTKFHEDGTRNVASRVFTSKLLTRFYKIHIEPYKENAPPPGGHVFEETKSIFEPIQDIIGTNLLTKLHEDRKINAPHPGGHVFQPTVIIFELFQDIIGMVHFTISIYSHLGKNAPPLGSHVFKQRFPFLNSSNILLGKNLSSKFHEDRKINVASRVLTRKNAPSPGGHVFQPTFSITSKFVHEDQTINVASRVNVILSHDTPFNDREQMHRVISKYHNE
ncbi:hypothetical protein DPMN_125426 [Dreissena polymorpha]|uniref:Uncharacterized protein n=1 Tax=Dreissena polymorpha TaxID=45954 RepID=A0A9D4GY62_DREPO|nr:hypothetical protein DPMN_125426 [Dreissena polymorpha]